MRITAYGNPVTQGSKIRTRWSMRDANGDTLLPWRDNVRAAALTAMALGPLHETQRVPKPFGSDPVDVIIIFTFNRPRNHFGTGRNNGTLKASAPPWPSSHAIGDLDKLIRACCDSLTDAGVWKDDSQVVTLSAMKVFVGESWALDKPGVFIQIGPA